MKTVIEMAREAGLHEARKNPPYFGASVEALERFAELVRADAIADEREACAKLCETTAPSQINGYECAAAIRARGETSLRSNQ